MTETKNILQKMKEELKQNMNNPLYICAFIVIGLIIIVPVISKFSTGGDYKNSDIVYNYCMERHQGVDHEVASSICKCSVKTTKRLFNERELKLKDIGILNDVSNPYGAGLSNQLLEKYAITGKTILDATLECQRKHLDADDEDLMQKYGD